MTNQDARPFVDLQKDAKEFREKFDEDIAQCIDFLNAKITSLICDQDSVSCNARSLNQNAKVEFSKAKYDIFISIKSFMNKKEREWIDYISAIKKLFVENVEIFLAGTKLEVKLPSSEFESSPGPRKSPGNRKSTSMTSSIYPILNNITKNIAGLGSPLLAKETIKVEERVPLNRGIRSYTTILDKPSTAVGVYKDASSSENEGESETDRNFQTTIKGRLSATSFKLDNSFEDELNDIAMDTDESRFGSRLVSKSTKNTQLGNLDVTTSLVTARQDGQIFQTTKLVNEMLEKYSEPEKDGDTSVKNVSASKNDNSSGDTKDEMVETCVNPVRGRKKKQPVKVKANLSGVETSAVKTRRGRSAAALSTEKSILEKENIEKVANGVGDADSSVETSVKTRRGRSAATLITEKSVSVDVPVKKPGRKSVKPVTKSHTSVPSHSKDNLTSSDEHDLETDVFLPNTRPARTPGRRKTTIPSSEDPSVFEMIPENPSRTRTKRKTICDFAELKAASSSKRLKSNSGKSVLSAQVEEHAVNDNLLESDDNYSDWMALKSVDGKIPTNPAVYEVKVWRAKKSAYIGFSESLRQKFTLYKLKQNSGHKHLDKFVDRNYEDIQVRFEVVPSVDIAKQEVKKRIKRFTDQYKTTPAYN